MKGKIIFKEVQSFRYKWPWFLVLAVAIFNVVLFGWAMYKQFYLGEPWGNKPLSDIGLGVVSTLILLLMFAVFCLFHFQTLHLEIDEGFIRYKFPPFINSTKSLKSTDVSELYVRTYSPISEFGGWGYRGILRKNQAYNVSGNKGLQIVFTNGKKLLIGTEKPDQLKQAIAQLKENWGTQDG